MGSAFSKLFFRSASRITVGRPSLANEVPASEETFVGLRSHSGSAEERAALGPGGR